MGDAAYIAIKYHDPDAIVVLAGLANDASQYYPNIIFIAPDSFLESLYERGTNFDVV